ncbi:MAG TPA: hypothetical protein VGO93_11210, partial [Candidatus Xenobia bacterium]
MAPRRPSHDRGMALGVVITVTVLVLLLGVLMATLAIFNLSMSSTYLEGIQSEGLARAAIT